jgi:hypothetical protein
MSLLHLENNFLTIEHVRFASKIISLLSHVFASIWYRRKPHYPIIKALVCFLFVIVAITSRNTGKNFYG